MALLSPALPEFDLTIVLGGPLWRGIYRRRGGPLSFSTEVIPQGHWPVGYILSEADTYSHWGKECSLEAEAEWVVGGLGRLELT